MLKSNKQKKTKKKGGNDPASGTINFMLLKKFSDLKISAPLNDEDYERAIKDLDELRNALVYWGKIILRQNKIRFIKSSRKIGEMDEYKQQAEEEEKFINAEKLKFDDEDAEKKTNLSLQKLKIAQMIDREIRVNKAWQGDDDDDEDEEVTETAQPKRGGARQAKRPNATKFKDIMNNEESFPTLDQPEEEKIVD